MPKQLQKLIKIVKKSAVQVIDELGSGWKEEIYQRAMEVALRRNGVNYENQRVVPINFAGHIIGESFPDLVVWLKDHKQKIAIVIDLKAEPGIKADHKAQVERYIKELRKQLRATEIISPVGLVINFTKDMENNQITNQDRYEKLDGVEILEIKTK